MQLTRRNILALPLAALLPALPTPRAYRSPNIIDDDLAAGLAEWEVIDCRRQHGRDWPETFAKSESTRQIGFSPGIALDYAVGKRGPVLRAWREFHRSHGQDIFAGGWSDCRRCWVVFTKCWSPFSPAAGVVSIRKETLINQES